MEWLEVVSNIALVVLVLWNSWKIRAINKRIEKLEKDTQCTK